MRYRLVFVALGFVACSGAAPKPSEPLPTAPLPTAAVDSGYAVANCEAFNQLYTDFFDGAFTPAQLDVLLPDLVDVATTPKNQRLAQGILDAWLSEQSKRFIAALKDAKAGCDD